MIIKQLNEAKQKATKISETVAQLAKDIKTKTVNKST